MKIFVAQIVVLGTVLAIWQVVGSFYSRAFFLIATPKAVIEELLSLLIGGDLIYHMVVTGSEALVGLMIGTLLGSAVGLGLWYSDFLSRVSQPFFVALGSVPVFAFAPLMIMWFGIGFEMKVALASFSTIFVSIAHSLRGASNISADYLDLLRGMDASRSQIFRKVIIPGSMNWVFASFRINVGFGLLGAFIGEFIASSAGLGYLILRASSLYNVPRALAAATGIVLLAFVFDYVARYVEYHRDALVQIFSVPVILWQK